MSDPTAAIGVARPELLIREIREIEWELVGKMAMEAYRALPGECLTPRYVSQISDVKARHTSMGGKHAIVLVAQEKEEEKTQTASDVACPILGTVTYITGPGINLQRLIKWGGGAKL